MNTVEVCHRAGITYRQLDYWTRTGRIPGVQRLISPGSGSPREWTYREAQYVVVLGRLVKAGVHIDVASKALQDEIAKGTQVDDIRAVTLPGGSSLILRPQMAAVSP